MLSENSRVADLNIVTCVRLGKKDAVIDGTTHKEQAGGQDEC